MQRWQADAALVLITAIWGSTFVIVKHTLDTTGPLVLIATRFWVAGLALLIMLLVQRDRANTTKSSTLPALRSGAITGGFLTLGFITQTIGLQTTEAGKAAFITGLSVILVPLIMAILFHAIPSRSALAGVIMGMGGLGLMTLDHSLRLAPGDIWVLVCAFGFAGHIISTGQQSRGHPVLLFTLAQMVTTALLTTLAALILERDALIPPENAMPAILYLGIAATAVVFGLQTWAQHRTTATHTALIFILEPVFAALFALIFAGEHMEPREWLGGVMILAGTFIAEIWESEESPGQYSCELDTLA